MNKATEMILTDLAIDSLGIYPQSWTDEKGVTTKRTDWQDGWNKAIIEIRNRAILFDKWFNELPILSSMVEELISSEDEVIRLRIDEDNNITMWILMNDTFDYACADGEDVTLQEIELVYKSWKKFGWDGVTAFVSNKRGELPLQQLQSEKFHEAIKFIKDTKE